MYYLHWIFWFVIFRSLTAFFSFNRDIGSRVSQVMLIFAPLHLFDALAVSIWGAFTLSDIAIYVLGFYLFKLKLSVISFLESGLLLEAAWAFDGKMSYLGYIIFRQKQSEFSSSLAIPGTRMLWVVSWPSGEAVSPWTLPGSPCHLWASSSRCGTEWMWGEWRGCSVAAGFPLLRGPAAECWEALASKRLVLSWTPSVTTYLAFPLECLWCLLLSSE